MVHVILSKSNVRTNTNTHMFKSPISLQCCKYMLQPNIKQEFALFSYKRTVTFFIIRFKYFILFMFIILFYFCLIN